MKRSNNTTRVSHRPSLASMGGTLLAAVLGIGCPGCAEAEPGPFKEGRTFAGNIDVSAHDLNAGYQSYRHYCQACHGEKGDGKGNSAFGLKPPPRDFTKGVFKFARLRSSDELPHDEDLFRIVKGGLHGTAMLPWDMPDEELDRVVQYIKTFAPQKWEKRRKSGELVKTLDPFRTPEDPWKGRGEQAIRRGEELYHLRAECVGCHPAYESRAALYEISVEAAARDPKNFQVVSGFREDLYGSIAKDVPEYQQKVLPPDFTMHPVRSICQVGTSRCPAAGTESTRVQLDDLFRLLSFGVYPVMPAWKDAGLSDEEIWAIAHYVKSLIDLRDTSAALDRKRALAGQPDFAVPVAKQ